MARPPQQRNLSVLFLAGQFHPLKGGSEVAALREAKALRAEGHDVRVLTLRLNAKWPARDVVEGVPVRRIGGVFYRGKLRTRYGAQLVSEALVWLELVRTRHTYDVLHLRLLGMMTRPAVLAAIMTGKPLIARIAGCGARDSGSHSGSLRLHAGILDYQSPLLVAQDTVRNGDIEDLKRADWLGGLTLRMLRHRNVTFVATSTRIHADLIDRGYQPEQIHILPSGVDVDAFAETAKRVREHSTHGNPPVVVCIGHLRHEKGIDLLLHAWQTIHRQVPTARLVLAGQGPLKQQLQDMSAELGIDQTVEFAGMIDDVRSLLGTADVFVLPSRHEGLSNALLEAMASGLPCVATRVSGSEDVIIDGASGLLVPPNDSDALASALITMFADRQRAQILGEAARQRIAETFSQPRLTTQLERLYADVSTLARSPGIPSGHTRPTPMGTAMSRRAVQPIPREEAEP